MKPTIKHLSLLLAASSLLGTSNAQDKPAIETPVITGEWVHIFNPNEDPERAKESDKWYTNDHCFAKGPDGRWHAYGIIGHAPARPWIGETKFFHISADSMQQKKWQDHGYALETKKGEERVLWAPTIYHEQGSKTWHMFYNIGNLQEKAYTYCSWGGLCRADSSDMKQWERHPLNPQFTDFGHARDSFIMKDKGVYYFYYTRTASEVDGRATIALRTSPDLEHWSGAQKAHIQEHKSDWGGDAESPYVVKRGEIYYLFICRALTGYNQTHVYWSKDPKHFPNENFVCELPTHASEVIQVSDTEWYISNTGWDKPGLYIAPMEWK